MGFDDDEHLIATAQNGSLDAFNDLITRYQSIAFGLALRMVRDPGTAEDITQESFLAAWSNLHTYRGGQFRSWLLRIVANRSYDELRRRGRRPADSLDALLIEPDSEWTTHAPTEGPESYALRRELSRRLQQAIDGLPHDQRLVLILADVQGHTYEEIAEITDANLGTVKSRLSRARGRVRDLLRQDEELFERYLRHEDRQSSP